MNGLQATSLLERERELEALGDALAEARLGRGRVVIVEAAAGLGKTSLLRAASAAAGESGFTSRTGHGAGARLRLRLCEAAGRARAGEAGRLGA